MTAELGLSDQLSYAFQTNFGTMEDRETKTRRYGQYGFANYLTYAFTDCFSASVRYEYYLQQVKPTNVEGKYHDVSFGLLYKPMPNIFILPEIRYDWMNVAGLKADGVTGAVAFGITY